MTPFTFSTVSLKNLQPGHLAIVSTAEGNTVALALEHGTDYSSRELLVLKPSAKSFDVPCVVPFFKHQAFCLDLGKNFFFDMDLTNPDMLFEEREIKYDFGSLIIWEANLFMAAAYAKDSIKPQNVYVELSSGAIANRPWKPETIEVRSWKLMLQSAVPGGSPTMLSEWTCKPISGADA